ncbi:extracellular solute-binding protein [Streptomyces gilvifuscus]|uniref:Extracellular solute-binding protein n=1 Tax=Streptomyces gilvifuscus TaxID=1550617 RepID=A0ABT5FNU6_9ACTN|nr:extracellular solute-binding protein [Streptomyces gilvifuscus]MDC2954180.1 extracellular solute-binding protein [Streptomyces gilvifuscus]
MRRRSLLALAPLGLVGACGLVPGDSDRRTVTVWLMKDSASQDFLRRFTERFEHEHTDLRLDIRIQQWTGIGAKVQAALDAGSGHGPDVIEVGNTQVPQYVEGDRLLDLTLESLRWGRSDWLPGLAEPGQQSAHQYGIPWYAANRVVIYRKDLFAKAGLTAPPRTREDWLTATRRLDSGGVQGIYLAGQDWYTLAGFIWDEGGDLASDRDGGGWRGTLDSPAALRGMDFYRRLQALGHGPVGSDEEHPPQAGVFAEGRVAQIVAVPGQARAIVQRNPGLKEKIGFFPVPGRTAHYPGAVFTGGSDLVVPNNTRERDGAVAVVAALTGATWDTDLARTMNYVPNRKSLAKAVAGEEGVAAMAAGAAQGRATPATPQWGAVEADNPIKPYMTKVLTGADPATEARRASRRITDVLNSLG